jgi:peptidyl-prolyl cis-trans isomerase SurA
MDPYSQVSSLKDDAISQPILDTDENGKKSYKLITVTNRINEHIADYATDYIKIKELALKEKQIKAIGNGLMRPLRTRMLKLVEYRDCDFTNNWLKNNFLYFSKINKVSFYEFIKLTLLKSMSVSNT